MTVLIFAIILWLILGHGAEAAPEPLDKVCAVMWVILTLIFITKIAMELFS